MAVAAVEKERNSYFDLNHRNKNKHIAYIKKFYIILLNWLAAVLFGGEVFPYNAKIESVVSLFFAVAVGWLKKFSSSVERPTVGSIV